MATTASVLRWQDEAVPSSVRVACFVTLCHFTRKSLTYSPGGATQLHLIATVEVCSFRAKRLQGLQQMCAREKSFWLKDKTKLIGRVNSVALSI